MTRPSSGAHASTVQRPSRRGAGRMSGSNFVCRTSSRFSALMKSRKPPNRRSASAPTSRCGRLAAAIRVLVEILLADEVHLDAESSPLVAFPDRIQRPRMCRRQRYGTTHLFVGVELGRSGPRVRRERDKTLTTISQQQLRSRSARALRGVEKLHVACVEISCYDSVEARLIRIPSP